MISIEVNDLENLVEFSNCGEDNFFKLPIEINECNVLRELNFAAVNMLRLELGAIVDGNYKCYYYVEKYYPLHHSYINDKIVLYLSELHACEYIYYEYNN